MEIEYAKLSHPLPLVTAEKGLSLYGGNQSLLPKKSVQGAGCGVISGANVLSYLTRYHGLSDGLFDRVSRSEPMPLQSYNDACMRLARGLLRPIPGFGINGIFLAMGLNLFFRRRQIPYRAKWCMRRAPMWDRMEQMLRDDLPVIFAVGPNWPLWKKQDIKFYKKLPDGSFCVRYRIHAHFITVTGMSEHWLRISSWGKKLYINREEYEAYVREHSTPIFSNLLLLQKR